MPDIQGLLGNPVFNMGLGLLGAGGRQVGRLPQNTAQRFMGGVNQGNAMTQQFQQLQAQRNQLSQQKKQQQALAGIQKIMQSPASQVPPMIRRPGLLQSQQNQLQGLLPQANPQAYTQGLISQQLGGKQAPRVSADLNTYRSLNPGQTQGSQAERDGFMEFVSGKEDSTGQLLQQAQLQLAIEELNTVREERQAANETQTQERVALRRSVATDLTKLKELSEINQRLTGTALESGLPFPELRRAATGGVQALQSLFGGEGSDKKARELKADFDTFNKLSQDFIIGSLDRFNATGAVTNQKFQALVQANAGVGTSPETNSFIIANNLEAIINAADIEGINIPNKQEMEDLIKTLRSGAGTPAQTNTGSTAIDGTGLFP